MDTFFDGLVSDDELLEEEGHLQKLKVRDDEVLEAASKVRHCVERDVRELSTEEFENLETKLHQRVLIVLNGQISCASAMPPTLFHPVGASKPSDIPCTFSHRFFAGSALGMSSLLFYMLR